MTEPDAIDGPWDVAIIGGGPSGLAAATRLRQLGVDRVIVLEREEDAGGVPRHCGHSPYGMREFRRVLSGQTYAKHLIRDALASGVVIATRTTVVSCGAGSEPQLTLTRPSGPASLNAKRVILATGIRETSRAARFLGGDRAQGILTTGALQSMVYLKAMQPFRRPVVLGTELVSFSALLTCRHSGARVQAMIEPNDRITARWFNRGLPALLGIPLHLRTELLRIDGSNRVDGVTLRSASGKERRIDCDGVVVTGKFTPESAMVRQAGWAVDSGTEGPVVDQFGRCQNPVYYATGNLLRPVETAGWCWQEGLMVAEAVHRDLTHGLPDPQSAIPVTLPGDAVRYVMAQRVYPNADPGDARIQLRLRRPVCGDLIVESEAGILWRMPIDSRPERRLSVPLAPILPHLSTRSQLRITVEETVWNG